MRKLARGMSIALVLAFVVSACGTHKASISRDANLPPADPQLLYKYITAENRYDTWSLWPGKEKLYQGKPPHGAFLTTYLNVTALQSMEAGMVMADGAIIVKENYSPEKELAAITVMYKVEGYNRAAGDWLWVKYKGDGTVQKAGKVEGCINCHGSKSENDYIFTTDFVKK